MISWFQNGANYWKAACVLRKSAHTVLGVCGENHTCVATKVVYVMAVLYGRKIKEEKKPF